MSVHFDPWRRIYDLYSFDAPYDLEPRGLSVLLQEYGEDFGSQENSPADAEDEDGFRDLDLSFGEAH